MKTIAGILGYQFSQSPKAFPRRTKWMKDKMEPLRRRGEAVDATEDVELIKKKSNFLIKSS